MYVKRMRVKSVLIICLTTVLMVPFALQLAAKEGMWIPMLIERYNIEQMQEAGLRLSAEDIYSINQDCLKDAVVIFGGGCTGEMISEEGLVLTNHHCGYGAVQSLSSVEHDYLTDGFWAMGRAEELPARGLSVTFLRYMKEVTEEVMEGLTQEMDAAERDRRKELNMGHIMEAATDATQLEAQVQPFYYGNAYYLFVYEVYRDVRLVGAPPEAIGNFGEDQDNWMWPRHTGDFSIFRVYADRQNRPATYDPANKPYKPRKHLEIAAGGIREGDFTMVMGYPGHTSRYLYSAGVGELLENSLPLKIGLRTTRLKIMDRYMEESDAVRIQYASKYRRVSNAWKKWQGMIRGLNRNRVVEVKVGEEEKFRDWVKSDGERALKYDRVLDEFERLYQDMGLYRNAMDMLQEAIMAVELFNEASEIGNMMKQGRKPEAIEARVNRFYKDFYLPIDREIFASMIEAYAQTMPDSLLPAFYQDIRGKYKGDAGRFAGAIYRKTIFSRQADVMDLLSRYIKDPEAAIRQLEKDPVSVCQQQFQDLYMIEIIPEYRQLEAALQQNYKTYMAALLEMEQGRLLYPDANFTMRVTYGKTAGFQPRDGVYYRYYTTLSGVIEKAEEDFEDYRIPQKLRELAATRDFGPYGVDGTMPVCFIASNHTSGGNSGSPVMNADGRLIGINFDRNWEGTMSDVYYDSSLCRNISVDIRYVLFIIDKYADAGYLLNEMDIVW